MIQNCKECGRNFNDVDYLTTCPHNGVAGNCREHDLFNCKLPHRDQEISKKDLKFCPYCKGHLWYEDPGWEPRWPGDRREQGNGFVVCPDCNPRGLRDQLDAPEPLPPVTDIDKQEEIVSILWEFAGNQQVHLHNAKNKAGVSVHTDSVGVALEKILALFELDVLEIE